MVNAFQGSGKTLYVNQDPSAVKDYVLDWSAWLDTPSDVIVAATWTADAGLVLADDAFTATSTTVWISGGVVGKAYKVTCHITTDGGRQDDRSFTVKIFQQ